MDWFRLLMLSAIALAALVMAGVLVLDHYAGLEWPNGEDEESGP